MFPRFRRSFYGKFIIFGIVITCFVLYFKFTVTNKLQNEHNNFGVKIPRHEEANIKETFENSINKLPEENSIQEKLVHNSINPTYEDIIKAELAKQVIGLGNGGEQVILTGESKKRGEERLKVISLNEELSELLSYNRTLSDIRSPLCAQKIYDLNNLPTTSVVIIFYNEPYSVILRTVHSVINTADRRILKEIILVDDASTNEELKGKLNYYVETRFPKDFVKILRIKQRTGLIRARLAGARLAVGDILLFLDAHCECIVQWLEPLAQRISESKTSVLVPIIDVIDSKDFQYSTNGYKNFQVGGFDWNGHFDWINISKKERERLKRVCPDSLEICPTFSPTMAGGLFAISREYFWEIGSYDEQMDGWGGENLEMSFRVWQCGGTIETIPCSRIGHIFRDFHPYSFPGDRDTHGINTVRMARVWMDNYIDLFFLNRPDLKSNEDYGDVTHRKMLRKKLKCKNFDWYLANVYPEKFIPTKNVKGYGRIKSNRQKENMCLDDLQNDNEKPYYLGLYVCHDDSIVKPQFFSYTLDGVLRNEISCATVKKNARLEYLIEMIPCSQDYRNEKWMHIENGQFIHIKTGMCLDSKNFINKDFVQLTPCDIKSESQKWIIEH